MNIIESKKKEEKKISPKNIHRKYVKSVAKASAIGGVTISVVVMLSLYSCYKKFIKI